jgi:small subunit ribosomal protein S16
MLRIRLSRTGKKRQPSYRVVVADINSKRDGRVVERIGHYNPMVNPVEYKIQEERALHWLSVGAQPSDAVRRLLEKQGTYDRLQRLNAGESLEHLVAEFEGVALEDAAVNASAVAMATAAIEASEISAAITEEE